jgi:hypothetical protein
MTKDAKKEEQLLTAEQVAEWLQMSPRSLEVWLGTLARMFRNGLISNR